VRRLSAISEKPAESVTERVHWVTDRLSQIDTLWSAVRKAHGSSDIKARQVQEELVQRYGGAARGYLHAALRDEHAAEEVIQEFALKFLEGGFQSADPDRGRFRNFLKTILFRMVVDYHRRKKRSASQLK